MIDASTTLRRSVPWTRPEASTTAPSSDLGPIAHVPTTCGIEYTSARISLCRSSGSDGAGPLQRRRTSGSLASSSARRYPSTSRSESDGEWLLGGVVSARGHAGRYGLDGVVDVEDTAHLLLDHENGARSVVFATVTNVTDSPVTIEIVTEKAGLLIRGDLTVTHADGRVETIAEPVVTTGGRAYWGASHELLIADFYQSLADPEPFWIGPEEGVKSLRVISQIYQSQGKDH